MAELVHADQRGTNQKQSNAQQTKLHQGVLQTCTARYILVRAGIGVGGRVTQHTDLLTKPKSVCSSG